MLWEISLYVEDDNQGKLAVGSRKKSSRLKSAQINRTFKRNAVLSLSAPTFGWKMKLLNCFCCYLNCVHVFRVHMCLTRDWKGVKRGGLGRLQRVLSVSTKIHSICWKYFENSSSSSRSSGEQQNPPRALPCEWQTYEMRNASERGELCVLFVAYFWALI